MKVTKALKQRPEFQAWVRQLRIDGRNDVARVVRSGYVPYRWVRNLRDYMEAQMIIHFEIRL